VFERYRKIQERREDGNARNYGFTLIELLIVIVVLGILAAIVIFSLTGVTGESKASACNADGKSVEIASDAYAADPVNNGAFPASIAALVPNYLKTAPTTANGYALSLPGATDIPNVSINGGATVVYNAANGCPSLG